MTTLHSEETLGSDMPRRYKRQMQELKDRLAFVKTQVSAPGFSMTATTFDQTVQLECLALQLRMILELIVYSSLVANSVRVLEVQPASDLASYRFAARLLERLEKLHPDFFPISLAPSTHPEFSLYFEDRYEGVLTKDDWVELYTACNDALHVWNPYRTPNGIVFGRHVREWVARIERLLEIHAVQIWGGQSLICILGGPGEAVSWLLARNATTDNVDEGPEIGRAHV